MPKFIVIIFLFAISNFLKGQEVSSDNFINELKINLKDFFDFNQDIKINEQCINKNLTPNNSIQSLVRIGNEYYKLDSSSIKIYNELNDLKFSEKCKLKYFRFLVHKIISDYSTITDFPEELEVLPIAISALNKYHKTKEGGFGIWGLQYFPATKFSYVGDFYHDNRLDLKFSTLAAVSYLDFLLSTYGCWSLAIAAYVTSPIYVNNFIKKESFIELKDFPTEIVTITNRLLALIIWFSENNDNDPFNIITEQIKDTVFINDKIHFEQIAFVLNLDLEILKKLNPTYTSMIIDGKTSSKSFYLPLKTKDKFLKLYDSICNFKKTIYFPISGDNNDELLNSAKDQNPPNENYEKVTYKIVAGDNLGSIAEKFGVKVSDLQNWNNIDDGTRIYAGQSLIIWIKKETKHDRNDVVSKIENNNTLFDPSGYEVVEIYEVKQGDSAYKISKKYQWTTPEEILLWNNINDPSRLQVGQKLKIYRKKK